MADPFLGEIRIFSFNFAPKGWAFCNGQVLPLAQNTALFAILGTVYGGDGKSTFALPNLMGAAPMQPGQGSGLSLRSLGESGGTDSVTLVTSEVPFHSHTLRANQFPADNTVPGPVVSIGASVGANLYATTANAAAAAQALPPAGGSQPHDNMQPYLTLSYCIAVQGIFPPRG